MTRRTYILVKDENGDNVLVDKAEYYAQEAEKEYSAAVHGDIESFVSHVDGSVITDRAQLREHNKRNNVVNYDDFGEGHWERARKKQEAQRNGTDPQQRAEIREAIKKSHYMHTQALPGMVRKGSRGYIDDELS